MKSPTGSTMGAPAGQGLWEPGWSPPRAYQDYTGAVRDPEDTRPDWHARKACNYVEQAVEVTDIDP